MDMKVDGRGGDRKRVSVSSWVMMLYCGEWSCIKQECRSVLATGRRHIRIVCEHAIGSNRAKVERERIHNRILAVSSLTLSGGTPEAAEYRQTLAARILPFDVIFFRHVEAKAKSEYR